MSDVVRVEPAEGVVAPLSSASLSVLLTAFEGVGPVEQQLMCHVQHGRPLPLQVRRGEAGRAWRGPGGGLGGARRKVEGSRGEGGRSVLFCMFQAWQGGY